MDISHHIAPLPDNPQLTMNLSYSKAILLALSSFLMIGCSSRTNMGGIEQMITRTEKDIYTRTLRDTAVIDAVRNAPGQRDNGIVYPTSRIVEMRRDVMQVDSSTTREYPNFIRIGLIETIGTVGGGSIANSLNAGLFGIYGYFNRNYDRKIVGSESKVFAGAIHRLGILEKRLRWFNDDPDWTLGTHYYESIIGDRDPLNQLTGIAPIYIRKRFFFKESIPYVAVTPAIGFSLFPDPYVNICVSGDLGSIGGLNLRTYLGVAIPFGAKNMIPYAGLGTSFLDFLNRVPETEKEWKYHEHSGWQIGMASVMGALSSADKPFFDPNTNTPFKGIIARIAPVTLFLPIANNKLTIGTSMFNLLLFGQREGGIGVLPIRLGYWQNIISQDASIEPFLEYNYYPTNMVHMGVKAAFRVSNQINAFLQAGYSSGSQLTNLGSDFRNLGDFDIYYIGIGIGLYDRLFYRDELRYD
ncbi:MAG: hypothetical protein ACK5JK_00995 [Ignavibacteria bacterium]